MDESATWTNQQLFRFLDHNKDGVIDDKDLAAACSHAPFLRTQDLPSSQSPSSQPIAWSYAEFASLLDRHAFPAKVSITQLGQILRLLTVSSYPTAMSSTTPSHHALNTTPSTSFWQSDTLKHLIAGGMAGAISRTVVSPVERTKILFQVQGPEPAAYQGISTTLSKIWREEGFKGMMRGNGTNVIRIVPYSASQFAAYEYFRSLLMEPGKTDLDSTRRLTAGAGAGVVSVVCTYPLDMVRTRLSVQSASLPISQAAQGKLPGIFRTLATIYKTEGGVLGLYRGLWPTTLGVAPYVALNFQFYECLKAYIVPEQHSSSVTRKLICGALAGSMAQTIIYPLDVLRRRMQITGMPNSGYKYNGTWDAIQTMMQREGPRSLYKGLVANYLKVAPAIGVSFVTYETCKDMMNAR